MDELLRYLATAPDDGQWRDWQIMRIGGSANNILYRATGPQMDLAVKFTIRDARRRAWREYRALTALQEVGLDIAPCPLLLDEERFAQPVVVQSWLKGEVTAVPPQSDTEWQHLITHYAALTAVIPAWVGMQLANAVVNFDSVLTGWQQIQQQINRIPVDHRPQIWPQLYDQLQQKYAEKALPRFVGKKTLCRNDGNVLNFLRRSDKWVSVDWENSGWGDPAFEIVDLMCHPAYLAVPEGRWDWVMRQYAEMTGDETAVLRVQAYYPMMLVWWVARWARFLYEVPRGKDDRLATRPANWQAEIERKMGVYVERVTAVLDRL